MINNKKNVLFLCSHNSCRSQIAEGFLNTLYNNSYEAFSAGIIPTNVNPYAVEVMEEIGIYLSKHYSKSIDEFKDKKFDVVVTVCDGAKEACPFFPGKKIIHKSFKDPTNSSGSLDETFRRFRSTRDLIKIWIQETFGELNG
jgi:arsenate reductase